MKEVIQVFLIYCTIAQFVHESSMVKTKNFSSQDSAGAKYLNISKVKGLNGPISPLCSSKNLIFNCKKTSVTKML